MTFNIVIPTINRKDLLLELLMSIENQLEYFDKLLVIDNGNQQIIDDIHNRPLVLNNKIDIYIPGTNLGVSGSWNYGINYFKDGDYILFLNDDVNIGQEQLKRVYEFIQVNIFWLLTGNCLWSMFMLSKECWMYFLNNEGYVFDEKFFPAYFEDNDFHHRLLTVNSTMHLGSDTMNPEVFRNSMTIKKDSKLNRNFGANESYYIKKWGGRPGHETFKTPFGK